MIDYCQMAFLIIFALFFVCVFFLMYYMKWLEKTDRLKRGQENQATKAVLSKVTNIPGLHKRPVAKGKDLPIILNPDDSLVGTYMGRLTYVRMVIAEERTPVALDIDMVHIAKVLNADNINLLWTMKGLGSETDIQTGAGIVGVLRTGLWRMKADVGDIEEVNLNDISLHVRIRYVKTEKDLIHVLDAMAEMCKASEATLKTLSMSDITPVREYRLVGNGNIKFEENRIVLTDPIKRTTTYRYNDIMMMRAEEFEDVESMILLLKVDFLDNGFAIFDKSLVVPAFRQSVRALILKELGLLETPKEFVPGPENRK